MSHVQPRVTRRDLLAGAAALCLAPATLWTSSFASTTKPDTVRPRFPISASDWMMLKRQKPGALQLAKDCGLDGVEVDMGPLGKRPDFENKLREEKFRDDYLAQAKSLGLQISSFAMSAFYGQSITEHPQAEQFCNDWIELMPQLGTKVGFLPIIFRKEDEPDVAVGKVVALMKKVAPRGEKAGVIIGLNTSLDAAANKKTRPSH